MTHKHSVLVVLCLFPFFSKAYWSKSPILSTTVIQLVKIVFFIFELESTLKAPSSSYLVAWTRFMPYIHSL